MIFKKINYLILKHEYDKTFAKKTRFLSKPRKM